MRWTAAAGLFALILSATPARAEPPVVLSAWAGSGIGTWRREGAREAEGTVLPIVGADAGWRFAPGRALVAVCDLAAGPLIPTDRTDRTPGLEHFAVTLGPEFSFPRRSDVAIFCRGSGGLGNVTYHGSHETGFAWSGAAGVRGWRRLGPFGFTFAFRAEGTSARGSSCYGVGATMGIALDPLD